jgi:hypothetical protein
MGLDDQDLSAEEQRLAADLARLAVDPSAERGAAIMAAVRGSHPQDRSAVRPWRLVLAGVGAIAILMAGTVGAVASSGEALPNYPNYSLRMFGEQVRLVVADPAGREQLRISFAKSRIYQARSILTLGDVSNARGLLRDSREYLAQTRKDLGSLSSSEQGQIQNQLNQAEADEHQAEMQLNQEGE